MFGFICKVPSYCDSAAFVAALTRPLDASHDYFLWHALGVRGQSHEAHEIYKGSGDVELDAKLTRCIVKGERVVVVVETFPWKPKKKDFSVLLNVNKLNTWIKIYMQQSDDTFLLIWTHNRTVAQGFIHSCW